MRSVVIITPTADRAAMNALADSMGYGPDTFIVGIGPEGAETHYGMHAWAEDGGLFHNLVLSVLAGFVPPGLEQHAEVLSRLLVGDMDAAGANPQAHFASVASQIIP